MLKDAKILEILEIVNQNNPDFNAEVKTAGALSEYPDAKYIKALFGPFNLFFTFPKKGRGILVSLGDYDLEIENCPLEDIFPDLYHINNNWEKVRKTIKEVGELSKS